MTRQVWRAVTAQTRMELALTARRGENVLVTVVIPVVLLVFFAPTGLIANVGATSLDYLVPGILSIAIVSAGMVNLGIATAYERYYGVLKRLGGSPLPRGGLLLAKSLAVLGLQVLQVSLLIGIAVVGYGWSPHPNIPVLIIASILGTVTFSAIGLGLAGALRAEVTLAIANGLYLFFLLTGNAVLPSEHLPAFLRTVRALLPITTLSDALRYACGGSPELPVASLFLLAAWAVLASIFAVRFFRWE